MTHHPAGRRMRRVLVDRWQARGFTLVELLIAMALTLILVYAVAQFYAFVGETVRDGRAQIEMGGNLRQAASRLQQDFAELTVRVGGRIDAGQGMGVLEIWEGIASDSDPTGSLAVNAQGIPTTSIGDVNNDGKPDGVMLGDCDDILVMTIRSQGDPFVGRWWNSVTGNYQIVQSNLAEVIWFTTFKDVNSDGAWQPAESRYLVRRQLLIRPDLAVTWPNAPNALPQGQSIYHHNDISCHVTVDGMGNFSGYATNSLSDLSQRENRCIHQNLYNLNLNGLFVPNQGNMPNTVQLNAALTNVPSTPLYQAGSCSLYSLDGIPQFIGEDKMLSNLLAFDVRVYDPFAVLRADNTDFDGQQTSGAPNDDAHGVLAPGDPGYAWATANTIPMGSGAYVDLWYNRGFGNNTALFQNSTYSWLPNALSNSANTNIFPRGVAWDTWSTAYEKDGLDQFGDSRTDWLTDGLDNDNQNGVDDPGEAETKPPYPSWVGTNGYDDDGQNGADDSTEQALSLSGGVLYPSPTTLRGIEVRIRIYEPGTRQTRQVTVATDFIPE